MERSQNAEGFAPWPGGCGNALARPRASPCSPAASYGGQAVAVRSPAVPSNAVSPM